jgi:hypothetical protein
MPIVLSKGRQVDLSISIPLIPEPSGNFARTTPIADVAELFQKLTARSSNRQQRMQSMPEIGTPSMPVHEPEGVPRRKGGHAATGPAPKPEELDDVPVESVEEESQETAGVATEKTSPGASQEGLAPVPRENPADRSLGVLRLDRVAEFEETSQDSSARDGGIPPKPSAMASPSLKKADPVGEPLEVEGRDDVGESQNGAADVPREVDRRDGVAESRETPADVPQGVDGRNGVSDSREPLSVESEGTVAPDPADESENRPADVTQGVDQRNGVGESPETPAGESGGTAAPDAAGETLGDLPDESREDGITDADAN